MFMTDPRALAVTREHLQIAHEGGSKINSLVRGGDLDPLSSKRHP